MGTPKLFKKAETLGITQHPEIVLYTQPTESRVMLTTYSNNVADAIKTLCQQRDPNTEIKHSGATRRHIENIFLAPNWGAFIWVTTKVSGMNARNLKNHVSQIRIWAAPDTTDALVQSVITQLNGDPLSHVKWAKIMDKFKVDADTVTASWQPFLHRAQSPVTPTPTPIPLSGEPASPLGSCAHCGQPLIPDAQFCGHCGKPLE